MPNFPKEPIDAFDVFDYAVRYHFLVLKKTIGLILIITLIDAWMVYTTDLFSLSYVNAMLGWLGAVLLLFFLGAMLYQTQHVLEGRALCFQDVGRGMLRRAIAFFLGILLWIAIVWLYYLLVVRIMRIWLNPLDLVHSSLEIRLIFIFAYLIPAFIFIVFMIFGLPLIIVDQLNPLKAMTRSYKLVGTRWLQAFTIYAGIGLIYILVAPSTLHAHFLMRYHVFMPFVLLMYVIFLPFICNYLLFMLNDFKLRLAAQVDF